MSTPSHDRKTLLTVVLVLALGALLLVGAPVAAQDDEDDSPPAFPATYYGEIEDAGGVPAPAGTTVYAVGYIDGEAVAQDSITVDPAGEYGGPGAFDDKLLIRSDVDEVRFFLDAPDPVDGTELQPSHDDPDADVYEWDLEVSAGEFGDPPDDGDGGDGDDGGDDDDGDAEVIDPGEADDGEATNGDGADDGADDGTEDDTGEETGEGVDVASATVNTTSVDPGGAVLVTATFTNDADQPGAFVVGLERNGTVVATQRFAVPAGGTETAEFTQRLDEHGSVTFAVNGTEAGTVTVGTDDETGGDEASDEDDDSERVDGDGEPAQFEITNATVNETSVAPGDTIRVDADVRNTGQETATYDVTLELDGEPMQTRALEEISPDESRSVEFVQTLDEPGTVVVSLDGVQAGIVTVGDEDGTGDEDEPDDGETGDSDQSDADEPDTDEPGDEDETGLLGGLLGVLPLGLFRTLLVYLGIPLLVVYLFLKALAYYLGY